MLPLPLGSQARPTREQRLFFWVEQAGGHARSRHRADPREQGDNILDCTGTKKTLPVMEFSIGRGNSVAPGPGQRQPRRDLIGILTVESSALPRMWRDKSPPPCKKNTGWPARKLGEAIAVGKGCEHKESVGGDACRA